MVTQISKHILAVLVVISMATSLSFGQQPQQPSQQYNPVPPAVHVPPQAADQLQLNEARQQLLDQGHYPASANQRFRNSTRRDSAPQTGFVQQTSFVTDENSVPEILAGDAELAARRQQAQEELARRAAQMNTQPVQLSAPQVSTPQMPTQTQMAPAQQFAPSAQQLTLPPTTTPEVVRASNLTERPTTEFVSTQMPQTQDTLPAPAQAQPLRGANETIQARPMHASSLPTEVAPVNRVRQVSQQEVVPPTMPTPPAVTTTTQSNPANITPVVTTPAFNPQVADTNSIRTGQTAELTNEMTLSSPPINVRTVGPKSIGINKVSQFQVVVNNPGTVDADKVIVGIDIPSWVEVANLNMTNGHKQITDGLDQARLIWTVDRVPAGQTQTLSIDTIARKAEMFDLGIEWTFAPRKGIANVMVTEPRLEMNISGPQEVQYGEKAVYHVSVRNPGTGIAENVNVMLPEALGGERAPLGNIPAGQERNFQVELLARTAGQLVLAANATGEAELAATAQREIMVRRGNLEVLIEGPPMKYAGSNGKYKITIRNTGDAIATDVFAAIALPPGVKYLRGADSANEIDGGLKWPVGSLAAGDQRTYQIDCQLDSDGNLQLEAGARANGDLAASAACVTAVETVADLVLTVADPKGPLPTGQNVEYEIKVVNRGTKSASDVKLVMQFSEGIEPNAATGLQHRLVPGQVLFTPITQIDPGEALTFKVTAQAQKEGTHIFRAQLTCPDSDAREIAEGTTRFFGDAVSIPAPQQQQDSTADNSEYAPTDNSGEFKR